MTVSSIDERGKSFTLSLELDIFNPNPFSLRIVNIKGDILIDDERIGIIDNDTGKRIGSGTTETLELTLIVEDIDLKILTGNELRVEGRTRAVYLFYEGSSPFEKGINLKPYGGGALPIPPTAVIEGPHVARVLEDITLDGSMSTDQDGTIVSYEWDLGDGTSGEGETISHRYLHAGVYNVELTVKDNDGLVSKAFHEIVVSI
ncbi:MAG TPA: PKD domain-containing protein [Euryarchaeota archaeon]|nr:MAG: hypothetical protein DRN57_00010 [Thermoplasmata archaeon]HHD16001.1 PKD domain-containing protein [Euryarchaeota archaeon]